ncbi:MAG: hypothetical protein ACE5JK_03240 [Candidatus Omnitrophota bacterium]
MLSKAGLVKILCKYPELIEHGFTVKGCDTSLYDQGVDILLGDQFNKKLAVQVRTDPIKEEHLGEILSHQEAILSGEDPNLNVMLVAIKIPPHLQKTFDHNGVAWKEITLFQMEEHLTSKGDVEMLELLG